MRAPPAAALAAAAALLAAPGPARAAELDAAWFERNPAARAGWLRACLEDARTDRRVCQNAERAETRARADALARRAGVGPGRDGPRLPPEFMTPLMRDTVRVACARPPGQQGLLASECRRT